MYNRYIHNSREPQGPSPPPRPEPIPTLEESCGSSSGSTPPRQEKGGLLSSLLGRFHLESIDSGDLLLIAVLILLLKDSEDEELLIALILLLVL